jgi:glucose-6-phosphate 1-epimerase
LSEAAERPDGVTALVFALASDEESRGLWPEDFTLEYTVSVGRTLDLALTVRNTGGRSWSFEEALHTYLAVSDVRRVELRGLSGRLYADKTRRLERHRQESASLRFSEETDRVYSDPPPICVVRDADWGREMPARQDGARSTVVWNPGERRAGQLSDFAPDGWRGMLCVEAASVFDSRVVLPPGQAHTLTAVIGARRL